MNERIRKLAEQADLIQWDTLSSGARTPDHASVVKARKFAELIVLECVTKLKETKKVELPFIQAVNEHAQELPLSVYIAELKQHFGVEE
jgi:hypothetical protein